MTTQSVLQALGLSVSVWRPRIVQIGSAYMYIPRGQLLDDSLEDRISAYSHTITGELGFAQASLTVNGEQTYIEGWIADGLNRHIEVNDPDLNLVWAGFVNSHSASLGPLSKTGGPVLDIVNRCVVTYTPIDYVADPPAKGPPTETLAVDNTDSQLRYGVIEAVLQGGEDTPEGAEQTRDTLLRDMAEPKGATTLTSGEGQGASIALELTGYGTRLDTYIFNDATTGAVALSDKIIAALAADPNGLFSKDYDHVETNAFLLAAAERDNRMAWSVIKACLNIGTPTDKRTFFGIYEDQKAYYWFEPTSIMYRQRIADIMQGIEASAGQVPTRPWSVRPGQWVFLPDFLAGRVPPSVDLHVEPRAELVERVEFTAPYSVTLNGERYASVKQLLAKKGLGGM
jgi:hypothetical protein